MDKFLKELLYNLDNLFKVLTKKTTSGKQKFAGIAWGNDKKMSGAISMQIMRDFWIKILINLSDKCFKKLLGEFLNILLKKAPKILPKELLRNLPENPQNS